MTSPDLPISLQQCCYRDALKYKVVKYARVAQGLNQVKGCLASGYPFVFGFTVYESFESQEVAQTGIVPMPDWNERAMGGHCVVAVGYEDTQQSFIIRNSWGRNWGMNGYYTMPYAYLSNPNMADDFWTIQLVAA